MIRIICVCGARPNFMKIAPIMRALRASGNFETCLVHTGQHYDERMSKLFFDELNIPQPDVNLEVGSGSHAVQTAEIMKRFEPVLLDFGPDYVLVVGDVNSTVACGLVAVKLGVKLIHVEAGLRSGDRAMPEEINRLVTDAISDLLFVSEPSGVENLRREGVPDERIHFVGNVMIDTLLANKSQAARSDVLTRLDLSPRGYVLVTLHRPSNVDDPDTCRQILTAFQEIQRETTVLFPAHPRTRQRFQQHGFDDMLAAMPNFRMTDPLGYLDFLRLMTDAALVMTDSGGIQEETTILGVPCLTLRENTERPVTLTAGTNRLVHVATADILRHYRAALGNGQAAARVPALWDGRAADRIAEIIQQA